MESSFWSYPGTWVGLGITAVMVAGFVVFALALRRTLRRPPSAPDTPPTSSSQPAPGAPPAPTPPESRKTP